MNRAIAQARGEVIVTLDGDTVFEPQTIGMLARHFADPRVGVVAGQLKVGNRRNILTAWQSLEYISGIGVTRMAEGLVGAITIAPGACAAWRKRAIEEAGGYSSVVQADDCDLTLTMQRLEYKVALDNEAVACTEAPMTVRALARQRLRWTFGLLQAYRHHRRMVLRPRYGVLGMVVLPYALLSIIVPLVFMPLTYLAAALVLASSRWQPVALFAAFTVGVHLVTSIVSIRMVRERMWHLLLVPVYRLIYEPLRVYVLYRSVLLIAKGKAVGWFRVPRTNSVKGIREGLSGRACAGRRPHPWYPATILVKAKVPGDSAARLLDAVLRAGRSQFTDQNVNRASWCARTYRSMVWKSVRSRPRRFRCGRSPTRCPSSGTRRMIGSW